jgi:hypothetical protein
MKFQHRWAAVALSLVVLGASSLASGQLLSRLSGQAYYDTDLNITWLADANLAASNTFGVSGISSYNGVGTMHWYIAQDWIAAMNANNYLGYNDWRLPKTGPVNGTDINYGYSYNGTTDLGTNISAPGTLYAGSKGSELAYLFYNELGNMSYCDPVTSTAYVCSNEQPPLDNINTGPFSNLHNSVYWSGTECGDNCAFIFGFPYATQNANEKADIYNPDYDAFYVWAVRDGDVTAVVDSTPPVLTVPGNITVNATSPSGAVVSYAVTVTDADDPNPTVSCTLASGSTFPVGTTAVNCSANDFSGNSATASFNVIVRGALDQISDLIALVKSFNIKQGIENSLDAKLQNVYDALSAVVSGKKSTACSKLGAFINEVEAQSGKALTTVQANQLMTVANRVKAYLGCS